MSVADKAAVDRYQGSIDFTIAERGPELTVGEMPVGPGVLNPFGTVHAGAILWFADVIATVMALQASELQPDGRGFPLALTLNANLLANQGDGVLRAEARFVRQGRRVSVVRTLVTGTDGRLLVDMTTTHMPA
ncbi:MAG: PaaI family thioesterase [Bauldia litoralis]